MLGKDRLTWYVCMVRREKSAGSRGEDKGKGEVEGVKGKGKKGATARKGKKGRDEKENAPWQYATASDH